MRNKRALFGYGVIGKVTAKTFGIEYCFDWDAGDYKPMGKYTLDVLKECGEVWICVPTPSNKNGTCDIAAVRDIALMLAASNLWPTLVIRSTVIPGTAEYFNRIGFNVISYPEFLSEATAKEDMEFPMFCVVGGNVQTVDNFFDRYVDYFGDKSFWPMDNASAELTKYAVNALFATLVTFGNQIFDVAEAIGADYHSVKNVLTMLPWSQQHHLEVMHKGYRGYGGKCLPKDTLALAKTFGVKLLKHVDTLNQAYIQHSNSSVQPTARDREMLKQRYLTKLSTRSLRGHRNRRRII